jgi:hypothetical protein
LDAGAIMAHYIGIAEGTYQVDEAILLTPGYGAIGLDQALIEVYLNQSLERRLKGSGLAVNTLLVELLEDHDDIDILLDLGGEFKYLLASPTISGGKMFSPDVKSLILFSANSPARKLDMDEVESIRSRLRRIDRPETGA